MKILAAATAVTSLFTFATQSCDPPQPQPVTCDWQDTACQNAVPSNQVLNLYVPASVGMPDERAFSYCTRRGSAYVVHNPDGSHLCPVVNH